MEFAAPVGLICSDNGEGGKWLLKTTSGVEISETVSNQRQFVLTFFTLFAMHLQIDFDETEVPLHTDIPLSKLLYGGLRYFR
jgi:hypothetical protein